MESQKLLTYWGLKALPGNGQVSLDQLYWQDRTQSLCSQLLHALDKTASLSVVLAPAGHGKSTLARWLYKRIDIETHDVALFSLFKHEDAAGWLLPRLASYLGLPSDLRDAPNILKNLRTVHDKILTIIIDNAHFLSEGGAFDEIMSLCQVQALVDCKLNFMLLGNEKLGQNVQALPGIQHRLGLLSELAPFSRAEIQIYLAQLLQNVGLSRRVVVPEALTLMAQEGPDTYAGLNALLEACFYEGFLKEQSTITVEIVQTALANTYFLGKKRADDDSKSSKLQQGKRPSVARSNKAVSGGDLNSLFYKGNSDSDNED